MTLFRVTLSLLFICPVILQGGFYLISPMTQLHSLVKSPYVFNLSIHLYLSRHIKLELLHSSVYNILHPHSFLSMSQFLDVLKN